MSHVNLDHAGAFLYQEVDAGRLRGRLSKSAINTLSTRSVNLDDILHNRPINSGKLRGQPIADIQTRLQVETELRQKLPDILAGRKTDAVSPKVPESLASAISGRKGPDQIGGGGLAADGEATGDEAASGSKTAVLVLLGIGVLGLLVGSWS